VAGNPVRAEFLETSVLDLPSLRSGRPCVLILGGSQGAHAINTAVGSAAARIRRRHPDVEFVHQTGTRDLEEVRQAYARAGVPARVEAFFDPVASELAAATLVVSRAGATTLAELAAAGRPAVLVPLPTATDDHQRKNAQVLARAGAAVILEQALGPDGMSATVAGLLDEPDTLVRMARAIKELARPNAARRIVDRVLELAE
jgi:UDP-N-acetylglucosamine--N-acetylmuramyl-(pentapeptide) pyrophosphoryl-undecaprenol N-acetylglucosamine transferase